MNSLLLGLALSSSPSASAHPPAPFPAPAPVTSPYRPAFPGYPASYRPVPTYPAQYQPGFPPQKPVYNPGYPIPGRPSYYPPNSPVTDPLPTPPFAPGEPTPGFPAPPHHGRPMTLAQFAHCFQPTPGHHDVCLIHPCTGRPTHVCFDLPAGCGCPKIEIGKHRIEFDYGRREIEIEFKRNGSYEVDYD